MPATFVYLQRLLSCQRMCATVQSRGHRPLHTTCTGTPATRPPLQLHLPVRLPPPVRRTLVRWWSTRRLDHLYLRDCTDKSYKSINNIICSTIHKYTQGLLSINEQAWISVVMITPAIYHDMNHYNCTYLHYLVCHRVLS